MLTVTWGHLFFFLGFCGFLHHLQLAAADLVLISTLMLQVVNLPIQTDSKMPKMTETLANGYSFKSTQ